MQVVSIEVVERRDEGASLLRVCAVLDEGSRTTEHEVRVVDHAERFGLRVTEVVDVVAVGYARTVNGRNYRGAPMSRTRQSFSFSVFLASHGHDIHADRVDANIAVGMPFVFFVAALVASDTNPPLRAA